MARQKCNRPPYKDRFATKIDADLALVRISQNFKRHRKNPRADQPTRSYECEFCRGWHLTSQAKKGGVESGV